MSSDISVVYGLTMDWLWRVPLYEYNIYYNNIRVYNCLLLLRRYLSVWPTYRSRGYNLAKFIVNTTDLNTEPLVWIMNLVCMTHGFMF